MSTATVDALPHPQSLGAALERQRLEHRIHRLTRVISALDERRLYRLGADGSTPAALHEAITGFRAELEAVRRRLERLAA